MGVIPFVDPMMLDKKIPYKLDEKSDIYSLGVMFWELTSRSSPLKFETRDPHIVTLEILNVREEPVPITNAIFVRLYQRCWEYEPVKRSDIHQVNLQLKSIDSENNNASAVFYSKEGGISKNGK
ncbi:hypothetical protein RhiirA4_455030 [Rhizophagus irregularis]|uniref:Protein kinase domain-containing protein n=1 Tax=Rhizophagus irregularis TaxID=588596 RepID=A0A2I1G4E8_9GLOM|nr:hypothetical protein RhiirA4_455030 [Rhizophagus irregularis]